LDAVALAAGALAACGAAAVLAVPPLAAVLFAGAFLAGALARALGLDASLGAPLPLGVRVGFSAGPFLAVSSLRFDGIWTLV